MGGVAPVPDNIQRQAATENAPKAEMTAKLGFVDYSQGKCAFLLFHEMQCIGVTS